MGICGYVDRKEDKGLRNEIEMLGHYPALIQILGSEARQSACTGGEGDKQVPAQGEWGKVWHVHT